MSRKVLIIISDGMADEPIAALDGRTPMEAAKTPAMDALATEGIVGLTCNVPDGMEPGSDVAIMSIMGNDPAIYYTGRGPLEAASMGVRIASRETAFRCNLVTLSDTDIIDYSAEHVTTEESATLIADLKKELDGDAICFHHGVSFRNLLVATSDFSGVKTFAPHDYMDKPWRDYLPRGEGAAPLLELIERAKKILEAHPVNAARVKAGLRPANSIWPWSGGAMPKLPSFAEKFCMDGTVVSAVDLVQGLGVAVGLEVAIVPGVTGMVDTNYEGKVEATLKALGEKDFALIHIEGPDEAGHVGDVDLKIEGIRRVDQLVVKPLVEAVRRFDDYLILILPDHPTPLRIRTHTSEPVPFLVVSSRQTTNSTAPAFSEREAAKTGVSIKDGHRLLEMLLAGQEK